MVLSASFPEPARRFEPLAPERAAESWSGLAGGVLDVMHEAVLLVGRELRLLGANRAARRLLREGDGLALSARSVVASTPAATCQLRRGIEAAARGQIGRLHVPRTGRAALALLLEPHPAGSGSGAAVVFATDPGHSHPWSGELPGERYGFTPAEWDVARRLAAGARLVRIATELGITLNTVRGHLKHIYAKAGVHRQAELVARLLSES
jgi:DNA-binding CsgD family transcriptional regulator